MEASATTLQTARFEDVMLPHLDAAYQLAFQLLADQKAAVRIVQEAYRQTRAEFSEFSGDDPQGWLLARVKAVHLELAHQAARRQVEKEQPRNDSFRLLARRMVELSPRLFQKGGKPLIVLMSILLVLLILAHFWSEAVDRYSVTHELAENHVRSLMPGRLVDLPSSDPEQVRHWLSGVVDFLPPVENPIEEGYPLVGARCDYLDSRRVAALVYDHHRDTINLFVSPASGSSPEGIDWALGYHMIYWQRDGLAFAAVSEMPYSDLRDFEAQFQAHQDKEPPPATTWIKDTTTRLQ